MRFVEKHTVVDALKQTRALRDHLGSEISPRIQDALSSHSQLFKRWREAASAYEATPRQKRKIPIENAPNVELGLAGAATDSIYAKAREIALGVSPVISFRSSDPQHVPHARALQRHADKAIESEFDFVRALDNGFLTTCKFGTGVWYIPWVEHVKHTRAMEVTWRGPRIRAIPPGDFLVPPGAYDSIQEMEWVSYRRWFTGAELQERAKLRNWDLNGVLPASETPEVRRHMELLGRAGSRGVAGRPALYEIHEIYADLPIDDVSAIRDLLIAYDRTSRRVLRYDWNPYDNRPFEAARYQLRDHLFYGIGLPELVMELQKSASDFLSWWAANALLANTRGFIGPRSAFPKGYVRVFPGVAITGPEADKIKPFALADVYPSMMNAVGMLMSFAERRTGVNDMVTPRSSAVMGSRMPGVTASMLLQQQTTRFGPAFDSMRRAMAGTVKQCYYRYQERLLQGDRWIEESFKKSLDEESAALALEVLRDPDFEQAVDVEMTATSAETSKDATAQRALMLDQRMETSLQATVQAAMLISNPQVPMPLREFVSKALAVKQESARRLLESFDVRDPGTFLFDQEDLDGLIQPPQGPQGLGGLLGMLGGGQTGSFGESSGGQELGGLPTPESEIGGD